MKVDNFDQIKDLLEFDSPDDCYFIQLLIRRSEVPEVTQRQQLVGQYLIYGPEQFERMRPEIIKQCIDNKCRAYIHLNRRSYKDVAFTMNELVAVYLKQGTYRPVKNAYWSAVGQVNAEPKKKWLVDIDSRDEKLMYGVMQCIKGIVGSSSISWDIIPTRSGVHLIVSPFNRELFKTHYPGIDVHKDSPTLLYLNTD